MEEENRPYKPSPERPFPHTSSGLSTARTGATLGTAMHTGSTQNLQIRVEDDILNRYQRGSPTRSAYPLTARGTDTYKHSMYSPTPRELLTARAGQSVGFSSEFVEEIERQHERNLNDAYTRLREQERTHDRVSENL
jgi:hypothetical protein